MTFLTAVTAAFALFASPQHANAVPHEPAGTGGTPAVVRPVTAHPARYVRFVLGITVYGVEGTGEMLVDRTTGGFVRRFIAGPASEREGWDGNHAWRADATGMARNEGNAEERGAILAWARLFAPDGNAIAHEPASRAPQTTAGKDGAEVATFVRRIGQSTERTSFTAYRRDGEFIVPHTIADVSDSGAWTARVTAVETPVAVPADAFAPPPPPHDFTLDGVDSLPMIGDPTVPILTVAVNGTPLHFLLDTGGQNAISPAAAKRAGLEPVGEGAVGGAGAGLAPVRFATARTVTVGRAELRDQPFVVLDFGRLSPIDGIVGYELLARFVARVDQRRRRVEFARDVRELVAMQAPGTVTVPMVFDDRQPQVDGALDGIPGPMTIDTGSGSAVDVNTPFVVANDLRAKYHASVEGYPISGVGGAVHAYFAHAGELRLGELRIPDVNLILTDARNGVEANPGVAANVGGQILRRFVTLYDYRAATISFQPQPLR